MSCMRMHAIKLENNTPKGLLSQATDLMSYCITSPSISSQLIYIHSFSRRFYPNGLRSILYQFIYLFGQYLWSNKLDNIQLASYYSKTNPFRDEALHYNKNCWFCIRMFFLMSMASHSYEGKSQRKSLFCSVSSCGLLIRALGFSLFCCLYWKSGQGHVLHTSLFNSAPVQCFSRPSEGHVTRSGT